MGRATGRAVITEDGYIFAELEDGSFNDGNDSYGSERELTQWVDIYEYDEDYRGFDIDRYDEVLDRAEDY